jgi:hypothetical protein
VPCEGPRTWVRYVQYVLGHLVLALGTIPLAKLTAPMPASRAAAIALQPPCRPRSETRITQ